MRAGRLSRLVTIQRPDPSDDVLGQPIPAWTDVARVWADIVHKSGVEVIRADATTSIVQASIRIRYRMDLDAGMRVICDGVAYSIAAVMPDLARRQYVDLVCETGASDG